MKNFLRAMRMAWPYRYRTVLSVICALVAAVFWGLNFTAIYPILKIVGGKQNLQEWVTNCIDNVHKDQIDPLKADVDRLTAKLEKNQKRAGGTEQDLHDRDRDNRQITGELAKVESKLEGRARTIIASRCSSATFSCFVRQGSSRPWR